MEMHHGAQGGYGLYRNPYGNGPPGSGGGSGSGGESPVGGGFGGRGPHLGGYGFPPMSGANSYGGYHHLGYPGSQSPVHEGKKNLIFE